MLEAAAGNPLALIELPALLSEHQRRGLAPFAPAPVPGGDLWEAFAHRVAALGPQSRAAVLIASASYDRALAPVLGACRELGVAVRALEEAEAAGVLDAARRPGDTSPTRCCAASPTARAPTQNAGGRMPRSRPTPSRTPARGISPPPRSARRPT